MHMVKVPAGKYVVAVSGGVDSMALLSMLIEQGDLDLVVAHVNHGIRADSTDDEELVRLFCMSHNIVFVNKKLNLGSGASEEIARKARYDFLQLCRIKYSADAIITAHHQDDLLETAVINLLRGTGWRGLAPFNQPGILRPLLNMTKKSLIEYAKANHIAWHEDSTNSDQRYLRNYVRLSLIPKAQKENGQWKAELLRLIRKQIDLRRKIEAQIDLLLAEFINLGQNSATIQRHSLIMAPEHVAYELLQAAFRRQLGHSLVKDLADAVIVFAKTALPGKRMPLDAYWQVRATKAELIVEQRPHMIS